MQLLARLTTSRPSRLATVALVLGFVLVILGSKWALIHYAGSSLPTWDQWDGEAEHVLRPWMEDRLTWQNLVHPNNEHRIVLTRLYALGLFAANGQWDSRLEMAANALVHVASALVLLALGARWLTGWGRWLFGALLLALFCVPFSTDNTLYGFQSQFYFLQLLALLHLGLTLREDTFTWRWGAGQVAGVLSLGAMGSGFVSSVALLAVLALRLVHERRLPPAAIVAGVIGAGACVVAWLTRYANLGHAELKAKSLGCFLHAALEFLSWPAEQWFPWSVALAVPLVVFVVRAGWRGAEARPQRLLLALVLWSLLQTAALALARGGAGTVLSGRYLDLAAVSTALGFLCLWRLTRGWRGGWLVASWLVVVSAGLVQLHVRAWQHTLPAHLISTAKQQTNTRNYLATGDPRWMLEPAFGEVPYPAPGVLMERLAHANIRATLPASVRPPLALTTSPWLRLPPSAPPAPAALVASTWTTTGDGSPDTGWRTEPRESGALPFLRFFVLGKRGSQWGPQLRLHASDTATTRGLLPSELAADRWQAVTVPAPAGRWWLEVVPAAAGGGWCAVTAPVELGGLSWWAERQLARAPLVRWLGVALIGLGVLVGGLPAWPRFERPKLGFPAAGAALGRAGREWPARAGQLLHPRMLFWVGAAVLAVAKLLLVVDLPLAVTGEEFTAATPWFAGWLALAHTLHLPLPLAHHVLYLAACGAVARALRSRLGGEGPALGLFALLWMAPLSYDAGLVGRLVAQHLSLPAALGLVAAVVWAADHAHSRARLAGSVTFAALLVTTLVLTAPLSWRLDPPAGSQAVSPLVSFDRVATNRGFTAYIPPSTGAPAALAAAATQARWTVMPAANAAPGSPAPSRCCQHALYRLGKGLRWLYATLIFGALPLGLTLAARALRQRRLEPGLGVAGGALVGALTLLIGATLPGGAQGPSEAVGLAPAYGLLLVFAGLVWSQAGLALWGWSRARREGL